MRYAIFYVIAPTLLRFCVHIYRRGERRSPGYGHPARCPYILAIVLATFGEIILFDRLQREANYLLTQFIFLTLAL